MVMNVLKGNPIAYISLVISILSVGLSFYIFVKNFNSTEEHNLNDNLNQMLNISIRYPYLEDSTFIARWPQYKDSSDERYLRYNSYCIYVFNFLQSVCAYYNYNQEEVETFVAMDEIVNTHATWWQNQPSYEHDNDKGYDSSFCQLVNAYLSGKNPPINSGTTMNPTHMNWPIIISSLALLVSGGALWWNIRINTKNLAISVQQRLVDQIIKNTVDLNELFQKYNLAQIGFNDSYLEFSKELVINIQTIDKQLELYDVNAVSSKEEHLYSIFYSKLNTDIRTWIKNMRSVAASLTPTNKYLNDFVTDIHAKFSRFFEIPK